MTHNLIKCPNSRQDNVWAQFLPKLLARSKSPRHVSGDETALMEDRLEVDSKGKVLDAVRYFRRRVFYS